MGSIAKIWHCIDIERSHDPRWSQAAVAPDQLDGWNLAVSWWEHRTAGTLMRCTTAYEICHKCQVSLDLTRHPPVLSPRSDVLPNYQHAVMDAEPIDYCLDCGGETPCECPRNRT